MGAVRLETPGMNWNDCYNSLAMAVYGALRYAGAYSLEDVLFYTGQGFIIQTDTTVSPMDVAGKGGALIRTGIANLGYEASVFAAGWHGADWFDGAPEQAIALIRESVDRGLPAVGFNLDNYEYGLVYGYDDEKRLLHIHDINARKGGELSYDEFGRRGLNGRPHRPELFVLTLASGGGKPHRSPSRYSPEQNESYRTGLLRSLQLIEELVEGRGEYEKAPGGGVYGIKAIEAWTEAVQSGTAHPFFMTYNLLWITSSRSYIVNFFNRSSLTACMSIQDERLQRLMMEASSRFLASLHGWLQLRQRFPFPKGADPKDPLNQAEAVRLLVELRDAELAGLETLRQMAGHLGS